MNKYYYGFYLMKQQLLIPIYRIINEKSIVLPLGEVSISRKVNSILIILRTNTNIDIWDQNKKRIFEKPKVEYTSKSISSLIKSIVY